MNLSQRNACFGPNEESWGPRFLDLQQLYRNDAFDAVLPEIENEARKITCGFVVGPLFPSQAMTSYFVNCQIDVTYDFDILFPFFSQPFSHSRPWAWEWSLRWWLLITWASKQSWSAWSLAEPFTHKRTPRYRKHTPFVSGCWWSVCVSFWFPSLLLDKEKRWWKIDLVEILHIKSSDSQLEFLLRKKTIWKYERIRTCGVNHRRSIFTATHIHLSPSLASLWTHFLHQMWSTQGDLCNIASSSPIWDWACSSQGQGSQT